MRTNEDGEIVMVTEKKEYKVFQRIYLSLQEDEVELANPLFKDIFNDLINYYLQNVDFVYNNKGVYEASNYYFQKELSELNFEQMATLIIMTNNPSLYNPKRRPELIKKRIKEIIRINKP